MTRNPFAAGMVPKLATLAFALMATLLSACLLAGCGERENQEETQTIVVEEVSVSDRGDGSEAEASGQGAAGKIEAAQSAVEPLVKEYGDQVAVTVSSFDGEDRFDINGDKSFVSASMIKLLVLVDLLEEVEAGNISLDEEYVLSDSDIVGGTGHVNEQVPGTAFTLDQLAEYMISYSDNTATNVLINRLGMDAINEKAKSMGLESTDLQRMMMDLDSGVENHMSTNDAATILLSIVNNEAASPELCERAQQYLLAQTDNIAISAGIPEGVEYGHKTGSLNEIRHDGGIVYADAPYVIIVFTELGSDAGDSVMGGISSVVYEAVNL